MKAPAFQFYADDFIGGTLTMSHEERGLYILALCLQWGQGSLAAEDIGRLAGAMASASVARVQAKFQQGDDGRIRNARLESERQKQIAYRERQSEFGKNGGRPRKGSGKGSLSEPFPETKGSSNGSQSSPSPSPSPSLISDSDSIPTAAASPPPAKQTRAPDLPEVLEWAKSPQGNVAANVAEIWWNEHSARPLHVNGGFTDKAGCQVAAWKAALRGYALKFANNDAQRARSKQHSDAPKGQPGTRGNPFL